MERSWLSLLQGVDRGMPSCQVLRLSMALNTLCIASAFHPLPTLVEALGASIETTL